MIRTVRIDEPARRLDETALAEEVAKREGGKNELNIAQITEVTQHALDILGEAFAEGPLAIFETLAHHAPGAPGHAL